MYAGIDSVRRHIERNWLSNAITNSSACSIASVTGCTSAENVKIESLNRATVYDVADFFWSLQVEKGFDPDELLDLYVDMCPRKWQQVDVSCDVLGDEMPFNRMLISADHHGVQTPVEDYLEDHIGL